VSLLAGYPDPAGRGVGDVEDDENFHQLIMASASRRGHPLTGGCPRTDALEAALAETALAETALAETALAETAEREAFSWDGRGARFGSF
jgi:hypothetical protein